MVMLLSQMMAFSLVGHADTQGHKTCAVINAEILKETTVKLKLISLNYRVKNFRFDDATNCFLMEGYDPAKRKITAVVNPYTGQVLDEVARVAPSK